MAKKEAGILNENFQHLGKLHSILVSTPYPYKLRENDSRMRCKMYTVLHCYTSSHHLAIDRRVLATLQKDGLDVLANIIDIVAENEVRQHIDGGSVRALMEVPSTY